MNRVFVTPSEVRGYGNIISEKTTDDFSLYQSSLVLADNVYTLSYNAGVTVSLGLSSSSVSYGTSVTLTATVLDGGSPVASGGTVTFYDGTTSLGTGTTGSDGKATLSKSDFTVGSHTLKAVYSTVNSSTVTLTVNKITPTLSLSASPTTVTAGASVTFSGTSSLGSGVTVYILKDGVQYTTATTGTGGAFSKQVSDLTTAGTYSFTAKTNADDTHEAKTSDAVSVTVNPAPTYNAIVCSADKSILSYADGDKATLYGQLKLDSSDAQISGVTVTFKKGSTVLGTADTDSTGKATLTNGYSSAGVGDITIEASADNGSVVSESYSIQDILYYDICTSDKGHWSSNPTFSSNGAYWYSSNSSSNEFAQLNITYPTDLSVEYEIGSITRGSGNYRGEIQLNGISYADDGSKFVVYPTSNWNGRTEINGKYVTVGSVLKHEIVNGTITTYLDNVQINSRSQEISTNLFSLQACCSRGLAIKNLKIKQL